MGLLLALALGRVTARCLAADDVAVELSAPPAADAAATSLQGLNVNMKLDDLIKQDVMVPALNTVVNTVTRQESTVGRSPAAIFVITPEMIKRSGVRSIPEALRMAPGIDVAKVDSSTWAISARGFNSTYANKLLVQIDRRVVYNATFGGVYWNMQDVVLEDVERIEVIRGPGTTAWGSNAVNGVINIITKSSRDTQGTLAQSGGGDQEQNFNTVRYGGRTASDLTWRAYGKQFDRNTGWSTTNVNDAWDQQRGGFRADYAPTRQDTATIQGDIFNGYSGARQIVAIPTAPYQAAVNDRIGDSGGNVLARYTHTLLDDSSWQIQSYYDRYSHNSATFAETRNTYDLDFQYQFTPAEFHQVIAGANYRNSQDITRGSFSTNFLPNAFTTQWASVFAEDTLALVEDRWYFTLGTRLEQNTFGHFQVEPTARLLFVPDNRQSAWVAVSRAVRNPNRDGTQVDFRQTITPGVPAFVNALGNPRVQPENVMAYEVGYRAAPTEAFSWDIAGYINDYRKLMGVGPIGAPVFVPPNYVFFPAVFENNTSALSYGVETTANMRMSEVWRLFVSYSVFEVNARGSTPATITQIEGSSPHNQVYLRSSHDLRPELQFDVIGRYVDALTGIGVPGYFEVDSRLGWQATKHWDFSLVGQNLINSHHLEFTDSQGGLVSTQVRRGVYAMATWTR